MLLGIKLAALSRKPCCMEYGGVHCMRSRALLLSTRKDWHKRSAIFLLPIKFAVKLINPAGKGNKREGTSKAFAASRKSSVVDKSLPSEIKKT